MARRLLGLAVLLLVHPAHAQSFNCRAARTSDEIAVCRDARLGRLDERLASRFHGLRRGLSGRDKADLDRDELAWLHARRLCRGDRACIADAYRIRISELSPGPPRRAMARPRVIERTCVRDARGNRTCTEVVR